jgi:hypothetical protein
MTDRKKIIRIEVKRIEFKIIVMEFLLKISEKVLI